jgi:copper chaperone CopZ
MEKLSLELPAMYGDHHVTEVRRILLELPGVEDVYASSGFQVVELIYDAGQLDADTIMARLEEARYSGRNRRGCL